MGHGPNRQQMALHSFFYLMRSHGFFCRLALSTPVAG